MMIILLKQCIKLHHVSGTAWQTPKCKVFFFVLGVSTRHVLFWPNNGKMSLKSILFSIAFGYVPH